MKIPRENRDLRHYVIRNDVLRAAAFLLWFVFWSSGAFFYNHSHTNYSPDHLVLGWKLAVWIAIGFFGGVILFRVWRLFTCPTVVGTIIRTGISHSSELATEQGAEGEGSDTDFRINKVLKLQKRNGGTRRVRFEEKKGSYLYYRPGTEVIRFHGLAYPVALDPVPEDRRVCAFCGRMNEAEKANCEACGRTLIDPAAVFSD